MSWFAPGAVEAQGQPRPKFQDLAAAMTVERGITCLDSKELVEHVSSWLGTDRVATPIAIDVHGSPFFARTVWFRIARSGETIAERRFEPAPARCDDLHAAVGLAVALALKASLLDAFVDAAKGHKLESRPFRVGAQALGGVAVLPGLDFGASLSVSYALGDRFAARFFVLGLLGPQGAFQTDRGRFKAQLAVGRLDVCSRLAELRSLDISACVGIAAGGLNVSGEAFPMSRHALIPYVAVANAVELDLKLSTRWSLTLEIEVLVPLRRTSFVVRDQTGAVTASNDLASAGALLAVGPAFHF